VRTGISSGWPVRCVLEIVHEPEQQTPKGLALLARPVVQSIEEVSAAEVVHAAGCVEALG
jgi:hypothetical protein